MISLFTTPTDPGSRPLILLNASFLRTRKEAMDELKSVLGTISSDVANAFEALVFEAARHSYWITHFTEILIENGIDPYPVIAGFNTINVDYDVYIGRSQYILDGPDDKYQDINCKGHVRLINDTHLDMLVRDGISYTRSPATTKLLVLTSDKFETENPETTVILDILSGYHTGCSFTHCRNEHAPHILQLLGTAGVAGHSSLIRNAKELNN